MSDESVQKCREESEAKAAVALRKKGKGRRHSCEMGIAMATI